jgi:hypothetical protein
MARAMGKEIGPTTTMSRAGITGTGETTGGQVLKIAFQGCDPRCSNRSRENAILKT